jgi:fatty-acyl-CoA synthase
LPDRQSDRRFGFWPKGLPRELAYPETSLYFNLEVSAARYPDKSAIVFYGTPLTYRDLKRDVEALAGYLQRDCGVKKGERVLLYLQNSPQFMIAFYAVLRADAVVVPVSPLLLENELRHFAADSGAKLIVAGQELIERSAPLAEDGAVECVIAAAYSDYVTQPTDLRLPEALVSPAAAPRAAPNADRKFGRVVSWGDALAAGRTPGAHIAGPDDLCVLPYTSGTTGRPRGCMHSHRTVMSTAVGAQVWGSSAGNSSESVVLCSLPLFHVTSMQSGMNGPIYMGQTIVLMQRWDRALAAQLIERHRVSSWANIATMAIDFLADPDLGKRDLSSLLRVSGGGATMPEAVAQKLFERTGLEYLEGYGLTETMAPSHLNPPHAPKRQCLGVPIFGVDSRVVDPDTRVELGPGETGEIVTSGPQVFLGYWNDPRATEQAFLELDGKRFFRTGDLGRCDEDGYFFMVDRLKRMINASGMKVWPAEVESLMYAHPDILEVCVIAARDAYRGETVKAIVVPKQGRREEL